MKIVSRFGTTEHTTDNAEQAKREHKSLFGLDGINAHDDEIKTFEQFQAERKAEHDAVKKATVAAPSGDQPETAPVKAEEPAAKIVASPAADAHAAPGDGETPIRARHGKTHK